MPLQFELTESFAVPPAEIFRACADIESYADWMPNFVRVEIISDGGVGVGTRFRETRRMFGRESTEHFQITRFEPDSELEFLVDGSQGTTGKGFYRFHYRFEAGENGGALMHMRGEIDGMGKMGNFIGRIFLGGIKKAIAEDHAALRSHLERVG